MDGFSPKAYLKQRRPKEFSDSQEETVAALDRTLLEYHLTTLTSRSQEAAFESFARQLCEREICPNLLPTTGPTGGGDSKADAETYPVSQQLSLGWLVGHEEGAAHERWAFAFSAKAQWAPKLESDIVKIVATERGYTHAFFVTNQYVKASTRAQLEDRLTATHGLQVRILDRTWILDRVFTHGHQLLAVDILGMTHINTRSDTQLGPQDQARRTKLAESEARISEALAVKPVSHTVVDHALEAAQLMRALEQPPMHVEAGYLRAERLASRHGTQRQKVEVAYQWASTRHYWLEDFDGFSELYGKVEERVMGSRNVFDLERLYTLWVCLSTSVHHGALDASDALLHHRTRVLRNELERLKREHERPSTSLQAETLLIETQLFQRLGENTPVGDILTALSSVIERSHGLVGFPLRALFDILAETGKRFEGVEEYDKLFEQIVDISAKRDGDLAAACLLLQRGRNQWQGGRPIEAIATLGRTLLRLYKEESREELSEALYICGCACAEVGLPWAARGMLLASASRSADVFWKYGEVTSMLYLAATRLKWVELSLGRLPQLLNWHENTLYLGQALIDKGENPDSVWAGDIEFEHLLSGLLLRTPAMALPHLESLPGVLDQMGLDIASDGLLFALGHEQRLHELALSLDQTAQAMASIWVHDWSAGSAEAGPNGITPSERVYRSTVMGCDVTLVCGTSSQCVAVAEGLLAGLEATLATAGLHQIVVHEPRFTIRVHVHAEASFPFDIIKVDTPGTPVLDVRCASFDPHRLSPEHYKTIHTRLSEACVQVVSSVVVADERQAQALFRGEQALERAFDFAGSLGSQPNVLGFHPKLELSAWLTPELPRFAYSRTESWQPDAAPDKPRQQSKKQDLSEEEVRRRFDPGHLSHAQMQVTSLIRTSLWDRAGWNGMGVEVSGGPQKSLRIGLLFKDLEVGRQIFQDWEERLGQVDETEQLRIVIVRGVDSSAPFVYRMVIGANVDPVDDERHLTMVSRIHEMRPQSSHTIDLLLEFQAQQEGIFLAPGMMVIQTDGSIGLELDEHHQLLIRQVLVREAWEIGMHDPEILAIRSGDKPIIPKHVIDAPVLEVLAKRERK